MDYNPFDSYICEELEEDALLLIQELLDKKLEHFRSLDKDEKAAKIEQFPNYIYEVRYTESVNLDDFRKVTLESWFQNLADQYGLREKKGRQLVVKDMAIVNHFATKWHGYLHDQYKGKQKVNWAVAEVGGKIVFLTVPRAIEMKFGGTSAQEVLAEKRRKAGKVTVSQEEKQLEEIAKLKAEIASRKTVEVTNHAPLTQGATQSTTVQ